MTNRRTTYLGKIYLFRLLRDIYTNFFSSKVDDESLSPEVEIIRMRVSGLSCCSSIVADSRVPRVELLREPEAIYQYVFSRTIALREVLIDCADQDVRAPQLHCLQSMQVPHSLWIATSTCFLPLLA